ncbi:hypothetical protein RMATCC62417_07607 [Rhizopus microsporus]|nr:hypothetical protein RMATCC62417_07607 [Rhizopus microsporus]
MSASAIVKRLGTHIRTAQRWVKRYNACSDGNFESYKKVGRKCILIEEHKTTVINFIDANHSATVVEVTEHLLKRIHDLKISHAIVYNYMRNKFNLSLKEVDFHSIKRNSPAKIEERYGWARNWENTGMSFLTNCLFFDESAFDINMKRSRAWSLLPDLLPEQTQRSFWTLSLLQG